MYILALDQGTTSSRAILFNRQGQIEALAQREFTQHFPKLGWVEHDPQEIWTSQLAVAREALSGIDISQLTAIGIANQRETTLVWDRRTGQPIAPAIVWQDRRTAAICADLAPHADRIRQKTGLVLDAYFSGSKIRWLLDHVPDARPRAEAGELAFGTVDTWLVWQLTAGRSHITDLSNASRTLLCNIKEGDWDDELLELFSVPRPLLPQVRTSSEIYGETSPELFGRPVPISGIAGDQQAALFGQHCTLPGLAKNTYGTGCFLLLNTGEQPVFSRRDMLTTVAWKIGDKTTYALEGSVFVAGACIQWLRDGLGLIDSAAESETLANSVNDTDGLYLVPAFTGLGAPHWDPHARGTLVGITRGSNAAHLARAALEGIAHQVADVIEAMRLDGTLAELRVDGGGAQNDLLMQLQADLGNIPVLRTGITEATALGAAYLAGLGVEYWQDLEEFTNPQTTRFEPSLSAATVRTKRRGWQRALGRAKDWAQEEDS